MCRRRSAVCSSFVLVLFFGISSIWAGEQPVKVQVHWDRVIRVSQTTPTLLLGASPVLMRGAPLHDQILQRVKDLGADEVRYAGAGYVYPHLGVAELAPPHCHHNVMGLFSHRSAGWRRAQLCDP